MITKLLEALDEKVFTAEVKEQLKESFELAVNEKAQELADSAIIEATDKFNESLATAKADFESKLLAEKAELVESIDSYLNIAAKDFIAEQVEQTNESLTIEKAKLIVEAMDALLVASGISMNKIVEAVESNKEEEIVEDAKSIEALSKKIDNLTEENIQISKKYNDALKAGILKEMSEGLTMVEAAKFKELADLVEFTVDNSYVTKLETIAKSIKGSIEESVKDTVNESTEPSWKKYV